MVRFPSGKCAGLDQLRPRRPSRLGHGGGPWPEGGRPQAQQGLGRAWRGTSSCAEVELSREEGRRSQAERPVGRWEHARASAIVDSPHPHWFSAPDFPHIAVLPVFWKHCSIRLMSSPETLHSSPHLQYRIRFKLLILLFKAHHNPASTCPKFWLQRFPQPP